MFRHSAPHQGVSRRETGVTRGFRRIGDGVLIYNPVVPGGFRGYFVRGPSTGGLESSNGLKTNERTLSTQRPPPNSHACCSHTTPQSVHVVAFAHFAVSMLMAYGPSPFWSIASSQWPHALTATTLQPSAPQHHRTRLCLFPSFTLVLSTAIAGDAFHRQHVRSL